MKTEVYSWRVSTDIKTGLEREARRRKTSLAAILDLAAEEWLKRSGSGNINDEEEQHRLHQAALKCVGSIAGAIHCDRKMRRPPFASVFADAMAANALIDTGGMLALLDRTDRWHQPCVDAFQQLRLPLMTSEAVLTELFHLVGSNRRETEAAWKFLRSGAVTLMPLVDSELPDLRALMSRYADRPMDFADATLVHLARRESLSTIFTVDYSDFETYRIDGNRRFRVLPTRRSVPARSR